MTLVEHMTANSRRINSLASEMGDPRFRASYFTTQLKTFLADQIRALRGNSSQADFGKAIGKPQSVVSRLENENYGQVSLQTLIDIANKLDIALIVRFTEWTEFLRVTNNFSENAIAPQRYEQDAIERLAREEGAAVRGVELMRLFAAPRDQPSESRILRTEQLRPLGGSTAQAAAEATWREAEKETQQSLIRMAA